MAEAAQTRVQMAMKEFIDNIDKSKLRPVQKRMYLCNAECMDDTMGSMEEVQRCVERCSAPAQRSQSYVQSELEHFQASLSRCVQLCQDDIKDKVGVNTPESELTKYRREFEACAITCCDKNIAKLPNLLIKIKDTLESGAVANMVYFTCDACGEQLKKPSVEKHYTQKCRDCYKLTCIDCLKDFYGEEYQSHTSCMSEDQRYSKEGRGGWDPSKGQGHKGENKQNAWVSNLREILSETKDLDSDVRSIVNTILDHENIPRKKPKFVNFVKNIMRNKARPHSIDKTWDLFSQALKPPEPPSQTKMEVTAEEQADSGEVEETKAKDKKKKKKSKDVAASEDARIEENLEKENVEVKSKKKKKKKEKELETSNSQSPEKSLKRKRDDSMEVDENEVSPAPVKKSKFDWDETITSVLMKKEGNEMKLNKLKKKCLQEFLSQNEGTHKTTEEIGAKFDKKLKKRKYRVLKDKVKLILDDEGETADDQTEVSTSKQEEKVEPTKASFNNWEAANLGSSAQNEKFRRLMGIKNPSQGGKGIFGGQGRNDQKIFRDLEEGFERARQSHFGGRCFES